MSVELISGVKEKRGKFYYFGKEVPKDLRKLPHKRRNPFEILMSWLMDSHVCQICGRKEIWSVSGWLQIDHPVCKDADGRSNICFECREINVELFGAH